MKGLPLTTDPGIRIASVSPNNEFFAALYKRRLEKNGRNNILLLVSSQQNSILFKSTVCHSN